MGAGAVGSYYGALLARAGHAVTAVARGGHLRAMTAQGGVRVREPDGATWSAPMAAVAAPAAPAPDLAVVSVKSQDTRPAAEALRTAVGPATVVLSLQNGVENVGVLREVWGPAQPVLGGLAFVGLRVAEPGVVWHQAEGRVTLGDPDGGLTPAARWAHGVVTPAWDATLTADIVRAQWDKLLWNAGFNTLCAVTGATAGEALATAESAALVRRAMDEVVAIARARGVGIGEDEVAAMAAYNPGLRDYLPSTAQDLRAGKAVERDALSGFVVREGARLGIPTPVNRVLDALLALQSDRATGRIRRSPLFADGEGSGAAPAD
jgi:2-dehydropantoate 2-reductase